MHAGNLIRLLRLVRGMNQKGVATQIGMSQQAFSKLEKQVSVKDKTLAEILRVLNISLSDFQKAMDSGTIDFIR